ncbi:MAG: cytochrome c biogenesis protein CcsA [Coriobacteriia bacterium]|nr:cytochrome c biogenesis protein CcsA [Coriobacteriia bacterium]
MGDMFAELLLMWMALSMYAISTVLATSGALFSRDKLVSLGVMAAAAGALFQVVSYAIRWMNVGHLPFLGFYEAVSEWTFATVVTLVIISWWRPKLRPLAVILMPMCLLALGSAMVADKSAGEVGVTLSSWWLVIHVIFTNLAHICFIVAFALAVAYLFRSRPGVGRMRAALDKLPAQEVVDDLSYRFAAVGLVFMGVMIVSGAIWANEAWGRYWGWDPIETWSLITWLAYALFLHCRLTLGWRGRKSAWMLVIVVPLLPFTLVGVPVLYDSIHAAYIQGF